MGRLDKVTVDNTAEDLFEVRKTALELSGSSVNIDDVFFMENLEQVESNIKQLNENSNKCWLLSSILFYELVYNKEMYTQSGLTWQEYIADSKKRLGFSKDEVSRQLSGARFFINHADALKRAGWTPRSARTLSCAELALELSGSLEEVIQHLVTDSVNDFRAWYSSFKQLPPPVEIADKRPDIVIKNHDIVINGIKAVTISDEIPVEEKEKISKYLEQIYSAIKVGDVPAIVPVYDENEARALVRLRDKNRSKK